MKLASLYLTLSLLTAAAPVYFITDSAQAAEVLPAG
jgi:hypothetical protein